jgi:6-phosphofructokinase 1
MAEVKKRVAILTSGGDAPGMNAVIRAVVRSGINSGFEMYGVRKGYTGLLNGDLFKMDTKSVSDIVHRGGTILLTARCLEMMEEEGQKRAAEICKIFRLDALIVIGGDGSFNGAKSLAKYGVNAIGIPGTIDLDIACTDYTIGFDTAVNTAMDAIGKIKDTSSSHERCSVVEVMGRNAGYIALWCAMTGGAEEVLIPEMGKLNEEEVIKQILANRSTGKKHNLVVVAEGVGGAAQLAKKIEAVTGIETRATILGHLQRGGSPTALDRMHASMMGDYAIELIKKDTYNRVISYKDGKYTDIDIVEALEMKKEIDNRLYDIVKLLAI